MVTESATKAQCKALSLFGWPNIPHLTFFSSRQETIENHKMNPDDFSVIDEYIRPRRAQVVLTSDFEKGNNLAVDLTYPNYKN